MTQAQLDSVVSDALGESVRTVHDIGFNIIEEQPDDLESENVRPAVECPFCRQAVPYPGRLKNGELPLAECESCDVYWEISEDEIFAADV